MTMIFFPWRLIFFSTVVHLNSMPAPTQWMWDYLFTLLSFGPVHLKAVSGCIHDENKGTNHPLYSLISNYSSCNWVVILQKVVQWKSFLPPWRRCAFLVVVHCPHLPMLMSNNRETNQLLLHCITRVLLQYKPYLPAKWGNFTPKDKTLHQKIEAHKRVLHIANSYHTQSWQNHKNAL